MPSTPHITVTRKRAPTLTLPRQWADVAVYLPSLRIKLASQPPDDILSEPGQSPHHHQSSIKQLAEKARDAMALMPAVIARWIAPLKKQWPFNKRNPALEICYASGLPKTHTSLKRTIVSRKGYVDHKAKFKHEGEVDPKDMLYLARRDLYDKAVEEGGNALANESWLFTLKDRNGVIKVTIRYRGQVVVATSVDPQEPVSINEAMTFYDTGMSGFRGSTFSDGDHTAVPTWYPSRTSRNFSGTRLSTVRQHSPLRTQSTFTIPDE